MSFNPTHDFEPWAMSRQIERAARACRTWKRGLLAGEGAYGDPFVSNRTVATRRAFQRVSELSESEPLREPLRRWVYRLLEQRINGHFVAEVRRLGTLECHPVEQPVRGAWSLSHMVRRALAEPERSGAWLASWGALVAPLSDAVKRLWQRRGAVARGLDLDHPDSIEAPACALAETAESWLAGSADVFATLRVRKLEQWLEVASGHAAFEGWPARLTIRSVAELVGEAGWLDGVSCDPGRMPAALAPASFLRALARLGAAWADGLAPADLPFVMAHDPYGLRRRMVGALFGTLPLNPEFSRRRLSVPAYRRDQHLRALGAVLLTESRRAAMAVLVRAALLRDPWLASQDLPTLSRTALGVTFRPEWCGALVRLHGDTPQRFGALLLAATEREKLIEAHDFDWFRNPRAVDQVRAETHRLPVTHVTGEDLAQGQQALLRWLSSALA